VPPAVALVLRLGEQLSVEGGLSVGIRLGAGPHHQLHCHRVAHDLVHHVGDGGHVAAVEPLLGQGARNGEDQALVVGPGRLDVGEPHVPGRVANHRLESLGAEIPYLLRVTHRWLCLPLALRVHNVVHTCAQPQRAPEGPSCHPFVGEAPGEAGALVGAARATVAPASGRGERASGIAPDLRRHPARCHAGPSALA
jgi:hypothetical protein